MGHVLVGIRLGVDQPPVAAGTRTFAFGKAKAYGKTARSRRRVPLSTRALLALEMIDRTYGHLAKGAEDSARSKLDAYAARIGTGAAFGVSHERGVT